jgi:large subunit ribosomal protein L30
MTRAVIRLRSTINASHEVKLTLHSLRLNRVNHCVLVPEEKSYDGMLQKAKDFITWGEIKPEVLTNMIIKRGRLTGDRPITNQYIKENTKHESLMKFAEAVANGRFKYGSLKDVKPIFRLHPPRQGFEGIKRSYHDRGSLGYRGEAINDLLLKMLDTPAKKQEAPKKAAAAKSVAPKPAAAKPKAPVAKKEAPAKPAAKPAPAKPAVPKPAAKKAEASPAKKEAPKKAAPAKKPAAPKEESK